MILYAYCFLTIASTNFEGKIQLLEKFKAALSGHSYIFVLNLNPVQAANSLSVQASNAETTNLALWFFVVFFKKHPPKLLLFMHVYLA